MRTISSLTILLVIGCGPTWELGEVCNQRNLIEFACELAEADGPMCTGHDYDDDGVPAGYDMDDRHNEYTNDPNGQHIGAIPECILDDHGYYKGEQYEWSEECQAYWAEQCEERCAAYENGTLPVEAGNDENEAEAYEEHCL